MFRGVFYRRSVSVGDHVGDGSRTVVSVQVLGWGGSRLPLRCAGFQQKFISDILSCVAYIPQSCTIINTITWAVVLIVAGSMGGMWTRTPHFLQDHYYTYNATAGTETGWLQNVQISTSNFDFRVATPSDFILGKGPYKPLLQIGLN